MWLSSLLVLTWLGSQASGTLIAAAYGMASMLAVLGPGLSHVAPPKTQ